MTGSSISWVIWRVLEGLVPGLGTAVWSYERGNYSLELVWVKKDLKDPLYPDRDGSAMVWTKGWGSKEVSSAEPVGVLVITSGLVPPTEWKKGHYGTLGTVLFCTLPLELDFLTKTRGHFLATGLSYLASTLAPLFICFTVCPYHCCCCMSHDGGYVLGPALKLREGCVVS